MMGLNKTISQIKEESRRVVECTRAEARSKVDEILAQVRVGAQRGYVGIERRSRQAVTNILGRGRTAAELERRGVVLVEKQRLIGATIGAAKAEPKGPEVGACFDMILKLVIKPVQPDGGELLLLEKDLERLPEGFEGRLNASLKDKGAVLHISENIRDMDGGFAFIYGGIEENRFTGTLFDAAYETLRGKVQEILPS